MCLAHRVIGSPGGGRPCRAGRSWLPWWAGSAGPVTNDTSCSGAKLWLPARRSRRGGVPVVAPVGLLGFAAHPQVESNFWVCSGPGWGNMPAGFSHWVLSSFGRNHSIGVPRSSVRMVRQGPCAGEPQVAVDHEPARTILSGLSITRLDQQTSLGCSPTRRLTVFYAASWCPVRRISALVRVVWAYPEVSCGGARAMLGLRRYRGTTPACHDCVAGSTASRSVANRVLSAALLPPDG